MIHFNPETRTFNLILRSSYYAFQVDAAGRVVHLGWGPRPPGSGEADRITGYHAYEKTTQTNSFLTQLQPDEIITYGDVTGHEPTLKVSFPTAPGLTPGVEARLEAAHLPVRDVRLRYAGHEIVPDAQPGLAPAHGLPVGVSAPRQTLRLRLVDPVQPFDVTLCYRLTPEHDILERWLELENRGDQPVSVEVCNFATLHLPNGTNELTHVSGAWAAEFHPNRTCLPVGAFVYESRSLQTGHAANPFFMLNRPGQAWEEIGTVYFGALAYSGAWRMAVEQLPTRDVRLHAGYNNFDDELVLAPGERHVTPALVCGVCAEGWGGASRRLHAFACQRLLPRPQEPRPVLYNSWEATYFNLSFENQAELARKAAAIGVELFCVDDGWFGARRSDNAGLGDWTVSEQVFPHGLEPLVEVVHGLGMKFGLWVEPEMVNADSDLYRLHPDWVLHFPGRPRSEARNQLILDFGRPEVVEHLAGVLENLAQRYQVDFFKWDMNRSASEPGSAAGRAIWRRHVQAVYGLIDRLRGKFPRLDIQTCSGGGGRVDLGIFGRTDQAWVSDNTDALDRICIQEGFSLAYPARTMEAWVTHVPNPTTGRILPLGVRFDVAMRGVLGIGTNLNELEQDELEAYARYIAFYKRIRHVVQGGQLYRLQRLEECGASVIAYVLEGGGEAVYSRAVVSAVGTGHRPAVPLVGLNAGGIYSLHDLDDREVQRLSGFELMTLGIPGERRSLPGASQTYYLRQVS